MGGVVVGSPQAFRQPSQHSQGDVVTALNELEHVRSRSLEQATTGESSGRRGAGSAVNQRQFPKHVTGAHKPQQRVAGSEIFGSCGSGELHLSLDNEVQVVSRVSGLEDHRISRAD